MTSPIARVLKQRTNLFTQALEQTRDVNEAHLLVHGVVSHALKRVDEETGNLAAAMNEALHARASRLDAAALL